MKRILPLLIAAAICASCAYFYYFYPPTIYRRAAQLALSQFQTAVASKDRKQIADTLARLLSDNAHIKLEVSIFSLSHMDGGVPIVQEFSKDSFIAFVDNILYTMEDYGYEPWMQSFALSPDHQSAAITLASSEWADGKSYYGGTEVNVRFSSNTNCEGQAAFTGKIATLADLSCKMELRMIPKPDEAAKFRSPEMMRELLR